MSGELPVTLIRPDRSVNLLQKNTHLDFVRSFSRSLIASFNGQGGIPLSISFAIHQRYKGLLLCCRILLSGRIDLREVVQCPVQNDRVYRSFSVNFRQGTVSPELHRDQVVDSAARLLCIRKKRTLRGERAYASHASHASHALNARMVGNRINVHQPG
jgi:hypothetical protein